ncbi:MAG: hypothetical protein HP496_18320, partial [Nitrospira sp.]|nr:hypothetical protein [Nitrospira sp.]
MRQFMVTVVLIAVLSVTATVSVAFPADDSASAPQATAPVLDVVTLKDGSIIYGEVIEMSGGLLQIKNS